MSERPGLSIIIEWDNARMSERERAVRMLRALGEQAGEMGYTRLPVKLTYDPTEVEPQVMPTCIEEAGAPAGNLAIELLPVEGLRYYDQKNYGFGHTDTELVIFLDSDVIPQEGWLHALLSSFDDPEVQVAYGNTFMTYSNLYERAFALFWFFHLREKQAGMRPSHYFFANNVAFRRETFAAHPFPRLESFRGQCVALARSLEEAGITIYCNTGASVEHPPPVDGELFIWRALSAGYDETVLNKVLSRSFAQRGVLGAAGRFMGHMSRSAMHTVRRHRAVGLTPVGAVPALGIAGSYYGLKLVGELFSLVNPGPIRRNAKI